MNHSPTDALYRVIWRTRRLFQTLRSVSDVVLEDSGINASQRAVLEFLHQEAPQTVPRIASKRSVSRQHIQHVVNELLELDLVEIRLNPAHKRSPFFCLTNKGKTLYSVIRKMEDKLLEDLSDQFGKKELVRTAETLQAIEESLREKLHSSNA